MQQKDRCSQSREKILSQEAQDGGISLHQLIMVTEFKSLCNSTGSEVFWESLGKPLHGISLQEPHYFSTNDIGHNHCVQRTKTKTKCLEEVSPPCQLRRQKVGWKRDTEMIKFLTLWEEIPQRDTNKQTKQNNLGTGENFLNFTNRQQSLNISGEMKWDAKINFSFNI